VTTLANTLAKRKKESTGTGHKSIQ
jgi:hypothetical protein